MHLETMTKDEHWRFFSEFCKLEIAAGGPDPHMKVVGHLSKDVDEEERLWRAAVYVGVYNVPSAMAIWNEWPWERVCKLGGAHNLRAWLHKNFAGIKTRPERRMVRRFDKLDDCLRSFIRWNSTGMPAVTEPHLSDGMGPEAFYDAVWDAADEALMYIGPYSLRKLLEFYENYCDLPITMPDIRPKGAPSPRWTLQKLNPEYALLGDAPAILERVNWMVDETREKLSRLRSVTLGMYDFEVLLCDYHQLGRRQYPGHSQDSELDYARKISPYWTDKNGSAGLRLKMFEARAAIFPHEHLGELQGWPGNRKELSYTLEHGYLWSDLKFDYLLTENMANPVERAVHAT